MAQFKLQINFIHLSTNTNFAFNQEYINDLSGMVEINFEIQLINYVYFVFNPLIYISLSPHHLPFDL